MYLRGYFINGQPVQTAQYGDTITYDVPGQGPGQIYLKQSINSRPTFAGAFTIPMDAMTLGASNEAGQYFNQAYALNPDGTMGDLLETSQLMLNPGPGFTGTPTMPPVGTALATCDAPMVPFEPYIDNTGMFIVSGCQNPPDQPPPTVEPSAQLPPPIITTTTDGTAPADGTTPVPSAPPTVPPDSGLPVAVPAAAGISPFWLLAAGVGLCWFFERKKR